MKGRSGVMVFCLFVATAASAWAGDKPGCKDPTWAPQRLPGFEISDCASKSWASMQVFLASGSSKLEGAVETVTYQLTDPKQDPPALKARDFYAAAGAKAKAKPVTGNDEGYKVYMVQKTPKGDVYLMYDHGSGNEASTTSYTLTTVHVTPFKGDVVARALKAPLDPQAKACTDPPWQVKGMPFFKLERCTHRDFDAYTFQTKDGDKTVAGRVLEHSYRLTDPAKSPVAELVAKNYATALQKIGANIVSKPDDAFEVIATQKSPLGEIWYGYVHTSGSESETGSYNLITVQVGGAPSKACTLEIYGVHFDTDKSTLRPDSDPVLEQVLALFKADAKMSAELSGHTDDQGAKDYNQKLSGERAAAVKAWLVAHGVDAKRLTTQGYGDTKPLVPNTTEENRAKNRRVELRKAGCTRG